ncbi:hypothetical protein ACIGMX_34605 [Streptomyces aquilus]|uniref:hypothetical protein n=1 Tax=Streptomyces aquilus TaxID=2548456 RepID=UPI0037CDAF31
MSEAADTKNPARYALFKALFLPTEGMSRASADELIDAFAHELAEQIRKQTARRNLIREEFADPWEMGLLRASDVIDPWPDGDKGAGSVRPDGEPTA